MDSAAK
jgi:predicted transcriptional regulator